jgi:hypothetical protein
MSDERDHFRITCRNGAYYVPIPDYGGGEVYTAEYVGRLRAQLAEEQAKHALTIQHHQAHPAERYWEGRWRDADAQLASARKALEPLARFAMWALADGSWQGADLNGGEVQDKAQDLGLIVKTEYDPKVHGASDCCDLGDDWFVPSDLMNGALSALTSG